MLQGTIGIVGAGVMAETMIAGLLEEGTPPESILASHRRVERAQQLHQRYGIRVTLSNREAASSDLVVLSVKPQTLAHVLSELKGAFRTESLLLSIVAGARGRVLQQAVEHRKVVRCMPNLPCRIRKGMTVWYAPSELTPEDLLAVRRVLRVMGEEVSVDQEEHVDRATAVSGTGPAIVAHFVKAYLEAAAYVGEPRLVARQTVLSTLEGTVAMLKHSDAHVAELIDEVTSPGGTTSRALQVLKNGRFSAVLTEAVDAAYLRSCELGDSLDKQVYPPIIGTITNSGTR